MPQPTPEAAALYEELEAAAMVAGEGGPIYCSMCMGSRVTRGIFGWKRCIQCGGVGFECLGPTTKGYMENKYVKR